MRISFNGKPFLVFLLSVIALVFSGGKILKHVNRASPPFVVGESSTKSLPVAKTSRPAELAEEIATPMPAEGAGSVLKYDLTRAKKVPNSPFYDPMSYEHADAAYKFIDQYALLRKRGGLSENDAKTYRELLQNEAHLSTVGEHYRERLPATLDFDEENSRLKMVNFIVDAVRLGQNDSEVQLYETIDAIMTVDLSTIKDVSLRKSLAVDRIELISVLKDRNPEYLRRYLQNPLLSPIDKKIHKRGMTHMAMDL